MHIQSFVALKGWIATVRGESVPVAGLGLVEQKWVVCGITTDGELAPLSRWGEVEDVGLEDVDDDDDDDDDDDNREAGE